MGKILELVVLVASVDVVDLNTSKESAGADRVAGMANTGFKEVMRELTE